MAVEGYETGEHAPGLRLRGTGAYRAAHHIIKVERYTVFFLLSFNLCIVSNTLLFAFYLPSLKQAHAKVWHSYDTQWRAKQKGELEQGKHLDAPVQLYH